jgi:two-component system, OmpR family, sensor histidine kinase VicK
MILSNDDRSFNYSDASNKRTEVYYGTENVLSAELRFFANSKQKIDSCMNYTRPQLAIEIEQIKKSFVSIKKREVKLRYLTEITSENISFCKMLTSIVDELRHLEGIKGNFMISESEYLAPMALYKKGEISSQIIYSNIKEVVQHQQYIFDSFWGKAISAQQRITEIEEGRIEPLETKVIEDKEEIFNHMKSVLENAYERSVCSSIGGMQLVYNNFFDEYKAIVDKQRKELERGARGRGVRWIVSIDKENIDLIKIFLKEGIQIRHVKNLTPMYFAVDSKQFYATIDKMEGGKLMESLLVSNEPAYIRHYNHIFEEIWKNGIDAVEKIKDIEAGVDLADIEIISSSLRAQDRYLDIVKTASEEILWIFPTTNAFLRQDKMGAIQLAIQAARERNVKVRILVPANSLVEQKVQELKECCSSCPIGFTYIEQISETKATILIVDRKASLVMELKDDTKATFVEAIGLSTYSNSKAGVLSYVAIFENLWKQSDLYKELMKAHEQLQIHDKTQKEFINIAAHELRTPIQPILGLTQIIYSRIDENVSQYEKQKQKEMLEVVIRNANRLQLLSEHILDATRIESQNLNLKLEPINLDEIILNAINDAKKSHKIENGVSLLYQRDKYENNDSLFIQADKGRLNQVISNLISNAIKFTKEGSIIISSKKEERENNVTVSVKDSGTGIDPEVLPRLFQKFATKSYQGTGLGLYISKSIVEAHGGKMWAKNNTDEKGAVFYFTLPIVLH